MISVGEALEIVLGETPAPAAERVALLEAVGRVLAEDVSSNRDVPGYANSAMDGYAVRHADLGSLPALLPVVGVSAAGAKPPRIGPGQAARIMTGAAIPPGADTVVRVEDTRAETNAVVIERSGDQGAHIRLPGEDVRAGALVLEHGRVLRPADVGLLSSLGRALVAVYTRPRVAIVSTGNELVEADAPVAPGQVVNSNAYTLAAAVREAGAVPVPLPIARDTLEDIRRIFLQAARYDAILSTGGVSVGEFDYVKQVMDEIGVERRFWRVSQKPGKPLTFGTIDRRPWFGLPGNPVSSLVCFYLYARPALRKMMGFSGLHLPVVIATLETDIRTAEGLTEFVRCRIERNGSAWRATSTGTQSSGVLSSMSHGQGLLIAPAEATLLRAGSEARVLLLDPETSDTQPPF